MILERDELAAIMQEIADAMSARGAALTLHPDDGGNSSLIHATTECRLQGDAVRHLLDHLERWPEGARHTAQWINEPSDSGGNMLSIPVQRVPGHSRLVITVYFDDLTARERHQAEAVYLSRRPFAIGYFRLWQLARTGEQKIQALQAALNQVDLGVMLLDRAGELVFANDSAETLLAEADGLCRSGNGISAVQLSDSMQLRVAIQHAISHERHGVFPLEAPMIIVKRRDGSPLFLSVHAPGHVTLEQADVAAIVYIVDPAADISELLKPLCRLHDLSPVETQLASLLVGGSSISAAAEIMHIQEQTARTYLKQIFLKTGTHRQANLVRMMLSSLIRTNRSVRTRALVGQEVVDGACVP